MPWCDECAKYWAPSSMNDDGTCPRCGAKLETPALAARDDADTEVDESVPWHFKLMLVALVAYLVWRFGSMIVG